MEEISPSLLSWASELDPETREQAIASATMPFIYPHVALMPDAHVGFGVAVGSVIPTFGAIMPAAVGVDIGCGMIALHAVHACRAPGHPGPCPPLHRACRAPLGRGLQHLGHP